MERVAVQMSFKSLPYDKALEIIKNCKNIREAIMLLSAEHVKLAYKIAKKFKNDFNEFCWDEMESCALLGLTKAASTYDIENKAKFASYASICIQNEILMYLRRAKRDTENVEKNLEGVLRIDKDGNELLAEEVLGEDDESYDDIIMKALWEQFREEVVLKDIEEEYLELRLKYGPDLTQQQLADIKGCSRSYISRIEQNLKLKVKNYFKGDVITEMRKNKNLKLDVINYLDKNQDKFKDLEKFEIVKEVKVKFGNQSTSATLANYVYGWIKNNKEKIKNEKPVSTSTKECNFNIGENGIGIEVSPIPTAWELYEPKPIEEDPILEPIEKDATVLKTEVVDKESPKAIPETIKEIEEDLSFDTISGRSKRGTFFITEDEIIQFLKIGEENPNIRFENIEDLDEFYHEMKKLLEIKEKIFGRN